MRKREPIYIETPTYVRIESQTPSYTPRYTERMRNGEIIPDRPYTMTSIVSEAAFEYKYSTWRGFDNGTPVPKRRVAIGSRSFKMGAKVANDAWIDDTVVKGRTNKLLSKIKGQTLPVLMLYKERKQTGQMVTKLLDDMVFFARNYKRPLRILKRYGLSRAQLSGNIRLRKHYELALAFRRANKGLATVGDYYLQWRFGWNPLFEDVKSSFEAQAEAEAKGIRTSARAGLEYAISNDYISPSPGYADIDGRCHSTGYFGIKATYRISDVLLLAAVQFMDIPETAWDMMPWSFIIDRCVNVSKYLNLRNATAGTEFISGFSTDFRKHTITGINSRKEGQVIDGDPELFFSIWQGPPRVDVTMSRKIMTGFPSPQLEVPCETFFASFQRKAEYAALVHQQFRRSLR